MSDSPRSLFAGLAPYLRPYRLRIVAAAVALLSATAVTLVLPAAARRMIDYGFSADGIDRYFYELIAVAVVFGLVVAARFYVVTWLGERIVADLRRAAYRRLINLDARFYDEARSGELQSRLNTDTELVQTVVGSSASMALRSLLLLLGACIMLVVTDAALALRTFILGPLVIVPIIVFGRRVRTISKASQDRLADMSNLASESLLGVRTVQAFAREQALGDRYAELTERTFLTARSRTRVRAAMTALVIVLIFGGITFVLRGAALDVIAGELTPGELSQFVLYAVLAAGAAGALAEVWGDLQRAAGAMERLSELVATKPAVVSPSEPIPLPKGGRGRIDFRDVSFTYPTRPDQPALTDFSLSVAPGETVALVGPSGAGKSTVLQLLLRFYDPQSGAITLDGVDLRQLDLSELRSAMGYVGQDVVVFSDSLRENITFGSEVSDEELLEIAEQAMVSDFVDRLPDGFDTLLGERGLRLSGGQRQRVAIARAMLTKPPIMLLDEATSALDAQNERKVQQALDRSTEGRTTLVIAHRLATVVNADRIVVIDQGQAIATGTHQELLQTSALYARLAQLQFGVGG